MLRDWLTVAFPLLCVSPRNFPRTSPCRSQSFGLLCLLLAALFCLLLAMLFSCLLLALIFCLLLAVLFSCLLLAALLFSVLFIISFLLDVERRSASASSLRCSSRCPRTHVAPLSSFHHWLICCGSVSDSHHLLLGCGSVCMSLSPLASLLWLCPSPETLCGRLHLPGCLACTSNTTARQCALRDRWLAVGARARWSCSLQQRVLLTMRTDLSFWSFGRFVAAAVRRWFPTPLRHHCVILWAVSTLITKAYIAASCHGVVRRFVWHRWRVIDPHVSLSSGFFLWSCHCHTLPLFVIVTCFAMSFAAVGCGCASCS